jgi:hypothetical protein
MHQFIKRQHQVKIPSRQEIETHNRKAKRLKIIIYTVMAVGFIVSCYIANRIEMHGYGSIEPFYNTYQLPKLIFGSVLLLLFGLILIVTYIIGRFRKP